MVDSAGEIALKLDDEIKRLTNENCHLNLLLANDDKKTANELKKAQSEIERILGLF